MTATSNDWAQAGCLGGGGQDTYQFNLSPHHPLFQNQDTHDWSGYSRVRSRFGVEVPLAATGRAWQADTFYVLADAEPFYRFDKDEWDPARVRGGVGCIFNDRVRLEFIYTAQFVRSSPGSALEYDDNLVELNVKIGLKQGILGRLYNPED